MTCSCGNEARYVDETGALTCALCPIRSGRDSIRIADVPALLKWCRTFLAWHTGGFDREQHTRHLYDALRTLTPRKP